MASLKQQTKTQKQNLQGQGQGHQVQSHRHVILPDMLQNKTRKNLEAILDLRQGQGHKVIHTSLVKNRKNQELLPVQCHGQDHTIVHPGLMQNRKSQKILQGPYPGQGHMMDDMLQNQNHNLRKNHTRNRQDIQDLNLGPFRIHPQGHPQGQLQGHPQGQLQGHLQDLPISHIKRSQNQNIGRGCININTVRRQVQGHPDLGQCQGRIKHRHKHRSSRSRSRSKSRSRKSERRSRLQSRKRRSRKHHSYSDSDSDTSVDRHHKKHGDPRKLPKSLRFDGKSNWLSFKRKFKSYRHVLKWSKTESKDYLLCSLEGKALDFVTVTATNFENYSFRKIMKKLESRFGVQELKGTSKAKFRQAYQKSEESLEDWADRVMTLATPAFVDLPEQHLNKRQSLNFVKDVVTRMQQNRFILNNLLQWKRP